MFAGASAVTGLAQSVDLAFATANFIACCQGRFSHSIPHARRSGGCVQPALSGFLARKSPTGWPAAVALALARRARYFARMKISPAHLEILGVADSPTEREGLPLYLSPVEAGFPSPADDFLDRRLDLHKFLVRNESATFFLRAHGESMINAGIHDGDLLVVDRSESAGHNRIVIAAVDGELTVKRLIRRRNRVLLAPENPDYPEIDITEHEYVHIWGVVTYVVHKL